MLKNSLSHYGKESKKKNDQINLFIWICKKKEKFLGGLLLAWTNQGLWKSIFCEILLTNQPANVHRCKCYL